MNNLTTKLFRSKQLKRVLLILVFCIIIVIGLLVWEKLAIANNIPKRILPKPSDIADYFNKEFFTTHPDGYQSLLSKVMQSFTDALLGFSISIVLGTIIGISFARQKIFSISLSPFVFITQMLPVPAFAPVVASKLGYGWETKIFIIVLFTIFPVIVSVERAVLNIPQNYSNLLHAYNANRRERLFKLIIPGIIPNILTTMKILSTASFVTSIIAELPLTVSSGIGKDIYNSFNNQLTPRVWSSVIMIAVVSLLFFYTVSKAEQIILKRMHYAQFQK